MTEFPLTSSQAEILARPLKRKLFLSGPAGSGKTTVGVRRCLDLLNRGEPASSILLLVPQRTLAQPYLLALNEMNELYGRRIEAMTVVGLARRTAELFWPLVAQDAGFAHPDQPPAFLSLETSLYYMAHVVSPLIEERGMFDSVTIERARIYSQILDNLNKAALVGFPYTEIEERLTSAWIESTEQANIFHDAQECANRFRTYCLENNLLDFSLQIELFSHHLWHSFLCREYLKNTYRHLIVDNIEEDTPIAHDMLEEWLPDFQTALIIEDQESSFRRFLGADPITVDKVVEKCDETIFFNDSLVTCPALQSFSYSLRNALNIPSSDAPAPPPLTQALLSEAISFPSDSPSGIRFFPQMLDWVVKEIQGLLSDGVPPREIVILAPLLPDSLRFSLADRLDRLHIPHRSHRPSRSLRDEPAAQALLTLATIAHPQWVITPSKFEVVYALMQSIQGIDLVRAKLLADSVYAQQQGVLALRLWEQVAAATRTRITYEIGNRYERLRRWLAVNAEAPEVELDHFFSRLFGEVLSQKGFGYHDEIDAGQTCANIIESARKFRQVVEGQTAAPAQLHLPASSSHSLGAEYVEMIRSGVLSAQYIESWQTPAEEGILIAPAYTFLLANQPVDHQFWLDVGSRNWFQRLLQPLTHPQVLTREWPRDRVWTDEDETAYARDSLYRLSLGLIRRCRKQIHLGLCTLDESGFESRGDLLRAIHHLMRQTRAVNP